MKTLTFTFFLILICSIGYAQSRQLIDSLKHELAIAKHDSSRVLIMGQLCNRYRTSKPDSALFFGEKGMKLSEKINFPKGIIRNTSAYGQVMRDLGNIPKAMAMQFKALQMAKENNLLEETGRAISNLGGNFFYLKEYSKALEYQKQAKIIFETYPSSSGMLPIILNDIGTIFLNLNHLDSALHYSKKAYDLTNQLKTGNGPLIFRTLANIQSNLGKNQLAFDYFQKGLAAAKNNNNLRVYSQVSHDFSIFFKKTKRLDSCIFYAKKSLEVAQLIAFKQGILDNSTLLAEIYETKDAKEAIRYYKMANAAKESLFGAGNIQAIQSLIAQEEARQKEIEDAKLAYDNQLKQYALFAGLAILLLVAFFLYRNNQKEKKAKNLLQEQKDKVESTLTQLKSTQTQLIQSEKLASLGELTAGIAHEIQNPLNFVNNFSELSVDLAKELKEEIKKPEKDWELIDDLTNDLTENQEKINYHGKRASSIVKGMLEHSRASTGVKELTDINKLADEYLRLAYHGLRAKDSTFNSDFKTDFDENLPKIEVIPQDIGRVLLNLINNAFYAIREVDKPLVTISTQNIDNQIFIKITDNGIGMSEATKAKIFQPFFTTKPTGQGTGLGLSLAYDIITKGHGGTIECESVEKEGTEFIIRLPFKTI